MMNWICCGWNINGLTFLPFTTRIQANRKLPPCRILLLFFALFLQHFPDQIAAQELQKTINDCQLTSSNVSIPDYFSPFYPNAYPNNTECHKLLTAPPDHIVELDFRGRFNIEGRDCHVLRGPFVPKRPIECLCQYDFLEVRDGPYGYSPLIGKFCGRIYPPLLNSTSRYMRLRFKSDDAIQFEGFYAVYKYVPFQRKRNLWNATDCHIYAQGKEGLVNATSIPKRFINDAQQNGVPLDCIFEITVNNDSQVLVRFTELKLAKPKDCDMDVIDIHQSSLEIHDRVYQFCGVDGELNKTAQMNSSKAFLRFVSDPTQLNDNNFNAYFTALRTGGEDGCDDETEFDCGDGTCIPAELRCDKRKNCPNKSDELNCEPGFKWKKTTLQSVIISVVVGIIILGVLIAAIYLTCNEKQISQPRRYFAPAPLRKLERIDEFGYGCTVDEMFARSKEEEVGYFVRTVQGPIVTNIPVSYVSQHDISSTGEWTLHSRNNGAFSSNSLPHNYHPRLSPPRPNSAAAHSPSSRTVKNSGNRTGAGPGGEPGERDEINLHSSLWHGVPIFMYSPNTKRKLTRVA